MSISWDILKSPELEERACRCLIEPGLEVYVLVKKGYRKKYAIFSTRFGSIDSRFQVEGSDQVIDVPDGVAHFLEHKLFEDEQGDVMERFAALGASPNAFTTFTHTTYLFSGTENFPDCLELLLDFVQEPYFTRETVQKEQGIIGQEIRMYQDHPQWRVFFNLLEALYALHPVRKDITGSLESIARITPELLYDCYRTFYHPSNMALFVVGDVDPRQVGEQVAANLARRNYRPLGEIRRFYPEEPPAVNRTRVSQEMVVSQPILHLGFKDAEAAGLTGEELLRRELAMDLLLSIIFAPSEPLYQELYEEGLIDDRFDAGYEAENTYAFTLIGGETRDPELLYQRLMEAIHRQRRRGIPQETFERHRRQHLGEYIRRFNSLEFIANNYLAYRFRGADFFAVPALLKQLKREEVESLLNSQLQEEQHALSLVLPRPG